MIALRESPEIGLRDVTKGWIGIVGSYREHSRMPTGVGVRLLVGIVDGEGHISASSLFPVLHGIRT